MLHKTKYIIFENNNKHLVAIMFPALVEHSYMRGALKNWKPVSAGFCMIGGDENCWSCFGKSVSMGIESRGQVDADILDKTHRGWMMSI